MSPKRVANHMLKVRERGQEQEQAWQQQLWDALAANHPNLAAWQQSAENGLPAGWQDALPGFKRRRREAGYPSGQWRDSQRFGGKSSL